MSKVEAILSQLKEVAANPKKAMDDYKAETGKGAVGIMPIYAPEEMVHATGYLPMGIWGAQGKQISKARTYLPAFACSIMQQIMELQCEGAYDDLAAVLFSVPCDTLKCLSQKWKGANADKVIVFTHPQNRGLEAANQFLVTEYELVKKQLEAYLGVKITNAALENSIAIYNENRAVMREFVKVAADYPQVISAVDRHAVFKARQFMLKEKHTALVKELIEEIKAMPVQVRRLLLQVSCWSPTRFWKSSTNSSWLSLMTIWLRNPDRFVLTFWTAKKALCTEWQKHGSRCMVAPLQQIQRKAVARC